MVPCSEGWRGVCWISIFSTVMSGLVAVASWMGRTEICIIAIPTRPTQSSYLNGFCKSSIVINRIAIAFYSDLLLDTSFHQSIVFFLVLEMQKKENDSAVGG